MKPIRILHIIPSIEIGGAEKLLLNSIKLLRHCEHHVVTFKADQALYRKFQQVAAIHFIDSEILSLASWLSLRQLEKSLNPHIIHSHLLQTNWLSRLAFPLKKKLINSIHSPYGKDAFPYNKLSLWIERITFNFSKVTLVFVSDYVKEDYNNFITLRRNHFVLNNFVPDYYFNVRPLIFEPKKPLKLVAVGNIKPLKNYKILLDAFKEIKDLPISLDVYGEGAMFEQYKKEVENLHLSINFKGSIETMSEALNNYHAFIFPSFYEGFSIALLEAMAGGMPLILSDIPMFKKLTKGNAIFFDPMDTQSCIDAIKVFWEKGFSKKVIEENKQIVIDNFSSEIYFTELLKVYKYFNE